MNRFSDRTRGVLVDVVDFSSLRQEALEWRQRTSPDCYKVNIHGGEWAIARNHDDKLFAICTEGVGFEVSDEEPMELELHGNYHKRNEDGSIEENITSFDFAPFGSCVIIPEDLVDYPIKETVDLADFVRSFGSRLESNFWLWFDTLK